MEMLLESAKLLALIDIIVNWIMPVVSCFLLSAIWRKLDRLVTLKEVELCVNGRESLEQQNSKEELR